MADLYIFTYGTLFYPDKAANPRPRPGVDRWFAGLSNGTIEGRAAVLWSVPEVGRRYALKAAGLPQTAYGGMVHEEQAEENAGSLAARLGTDLIFLSFSWFNYADIRLDHGEVPIPEERTDDPRWSTKWRFPEPGMVAAALKETGVTPGAALLVTDTQNEDGAGFRLFVPRIYGPHFFLSWPNHERHVKTRRVTRRPLDEWEK